VPLTRGLFELLTTDALAEQLAELEPQLHADVSTLRPAEAADRIAQHLARLIQRALETVGDKDRVATGIAVARALVAQLGAALPDAEVDPDAPEPRGRVLRAIARRQPDGSLEALSEPLIPLLDSALLTNAPGEPRVGSQIGTEIASADRIDVVMAFVRRSGLAPLMEAIRRHREAGRGLRILTTTYTGSTEARALDELRKLGAEVRVSYDTSSTRLHAKAWLFHRDSGFSTAYIGSSNLTHSAQVTGLEWNVRVSGARNPDIVAKVAAVFESYWNGDDFVPYEADEFAQRTAVADAGTTRFVLPPTELRPEPFQERLLELIASSRQRGHHRNLLVSATGTGKTVMAAIDYARLRQALPRARLLFVAHREEILEKSRDTFRHCLRDPGFGELWVGGERPRRFDHVFASIQSLHASKLELLDPGHFDVVVVDEFHHAASRSYRALLERVTPVELLGLTATPERSDGLPLLHFFDGRIAAELRLWDAIDQHRLSPFAYYGVHDGLDLREVPWRRGRGYDVEGLTNLLTANDVWARRVLGRVADRVEDPSRMRALGFCVSVDHARFMARVFNEAGIPSIAIWSDSPEDERKAALAQLASGEKNVVFSVDLFNEGIDVPRVDTLLLLRPTDSPTLFLQQLGRGLRRATGKTVCTVLDFVGHHRREFRFDRRFRALLGGSRRDLEAQVQQGFPFLPAGCDLQLDPVARDLVLANLRESIPSQWTAKVEELRQLARGDAGLSLSRYLEESGLDLEDVYTGTKSWSDLRDDAGLATLPRGPREDELRRACGRLLHVDDAARIDAYRRLLIGPTPPTPPTPSALDERTRRFLRMLVASVLPKATDKSTSLAEATALLWSHPQVRAELVELLDALAERVDRVHVALAQPGGTPLQVHARYSRIEILAAFGIGEAGKVAPWQTGVYWAKDARADLLAFTLDKTSGQFSPTTRYRDYAISRELIHWESQSATRAESATGLRYRHHASQGSHVMLFARLRNDDRAFWFLGPARYVSHQGEQPMAVTWRLDVPLPGDLFASFAAAVA
jgi:superfamily II DNA or RNA helicase